MIQSRKDLNFYIAEDCKRNGQNRGILHYMWNLLRGPASSHSLISAKLDLIGKGGVCEVAVQT